jgi:hypothetical protein
LYLHSLDSFTQLEQLIEFYVREHNTQMPHYAFVAYSARLEHPFRRDLSTPSGGLGHLIGA